MHTATGTQLALLSPAKRSSTSETMSRIGPRDTAPELLLRKALRQKGLRYRVCVKDLPGKPDIVFPSAKLAVFVDGDFWHGNQWRLRGFDSSEGQLSRVHNAEYWTAKIQRNVDRDFRNTDKLLDMGWRVIRFWESQISSDPDQCIANTLVALKAPPHEECAYSEIPRRSTTELFAGIGLVRLGLDSSGWKVVFANDNDPHKIEMYASNFPANHLDPRSVMELPGDSIPSCALMTGSFPCNDLSLAGSRNGIHGQHSGLFWQMVRLLEEMGSRRPPLILLENVFGFLSSNDGRDFQAALTALSDLGYSCDAFAIDASHFVPQSRVRLFVVAKHGMSEKPVWGLTPGPLRPQRLLDFIYRTKGIRWDVRPLPELPLRSNALSNVLESVPHSSSAWWDEDRSKYFFTQLSPRHRKLAEAMIAGRDYQYGTAFRRIRHGRSMAELRVDGVAGCLRTPRGGSGRQILFKAGRGKFWVRLLTARECARLQGVEDSSYTIDVGLNQALFGFGDAVCVPVIAWIARNYLNPVAKELLRGRVLARPLPRFE